MKYHAPTGMNLESTIRRRSRAQRPRAVRFHAHETPAQAHPERQKADERSPASGGAGAGPGEELLVGAGCTLRQMETSWN